MARRNMLKTAEKARGIGKTNLKYDLYSDEVVELMHIATDAPYNVNNVYEAICIAFYYGYVLGGRAVAKGDKAF